MGIHSTEKRIVFHRKGGEPEHEDSLSVFLLQKEGFKDKSGLQAVVRHVIPIGIWWKVEVEAESSFEGKGHKPTEGTGTSLMDDGQAKGR